jgi:hypothetical protein
MARRGAAFRVPVPPMIYSARGVFLLIALLAAAPFGRVTGSLTCDLPSRDTVSGRRDCGAHVSRSEFPVGHDLSPRTPNAARFKATPIPVPYQEPFPGAAC